MKIIITMAGMGSRFKKIGLKIPKHEIVAREKTLFEWSLISLEDFFNEQFIFITRKGNYNKEFIHNICDKLGISNWQIRELENLTEGQASTVMEIDDLLEEDDAIGVYNIDTYISPSEIKKSDIQDKHEGFIPAFYAEGDKWSFILPDKDKVIKVTEKVRISTLGTVGFYYFKKWKRYKEIYLTYKEEIKKQYRETYIAPMYQYMINEGSCVGYSIINKGALNVLGTPEDIQVFDKYYIEKNLKEC